MSFNSVNLPSPGHGDLWTDDVRAIRATASFFNDTRALSQNLCRDVDLSLKMALDLAGYIASDACARTGRGSFEPKTWARIEKDARAVRETLVGRRDEGGEPLHWWDAFSKLAGSLSWLADQMEAGAVHCCECDAFIGRTTCKITATSPTQCQECHREYLRDVCRA